MAWGRKKKKLISDDEAGARQVGLGLAGFLGAGELAQMAGGGQSLAAMGNHLVPEADFTKIRQKMDPKGRVRFFTPKEFEKSTGVPLSGISYSREAVDHFSKDPDPDIATFAKKVKSLLGPKQKGAVVTGPSPALYSHELGHLGGRALPSKIYQKFNTGALGRLPMGAIQGAALIGLGATDKMTDKQKALTAGGITAATSIPAATVAWEEGRASLRGLRKLRKAVGPAKFKKIRKYRPLAAAFGTYASSLLPSLVGSIGTGMFAKRHFDKKKQLKVKKSSPGHFMKLAFRLKEAQPSLVM